MIQKILIFMLFALLGCQNTKENETKNKEKPVLEVKKQAKKQKTDSTKKISITKTASPSRLTKNYLYFICDNDKVILVKKMFLARKSKLF
jgi:hypothetical protein